MSKLIFLMVQAIQQSSWRTQFTHQTLPSPLYPSQDLILWSVVPYLKMRNVPFHTLMGELQPPSHYPMDYTDLLQKNLVQALIMPSLQAQKWASMRLTKNLDIHITHAAIKHMVETGMVTGIKLNPHSKPEFCKQCAKAKSNCQPFPKESVMQATRYGEWVHWDLWGPARVHSLAGHSYVAARMDNMTWEMKLYF